MIPEFETEKKHTLQFLQAADAGNQDARVLAYDPAIGLLLVQKTAEASRPQQLVALPRPGGGLDWVELGGRPGGADRPSWVPGAVTGSATDRALVEPIAHGGTKTTGAVRFEEAWSSRLT